MQEELADLRAHLEQLDEQLAMLEDRVGSVTGRMDGLEDRILAGSDTRPRQFPTLTDWVDQVYSRLAARHDPVWCTTWVAHDEAVRRLKNLWETWEQANAGSDPGDIDAWMRDRFDHHSTLLHAPDGTFRACRPGVRCAAPPRLGALRATPPVAHLNRAKTATGVRP